MIKPRRSLRKATRLFSRTQALLRSTGQRCLHASAAEIKANGQVICYLVHQDIGHLGIFVSGKIAQKEHNEIIGTLEVIESAAPGLYELIITDKTVVDGQLHYSVALAEREISDILALDSDGREDEEPFVAAARVSEVNEKLYTGLVRPVIKAATNENSAKLHRALHPLRAQRSLLSDANPALWPVGPLADSIRATRRPVSPDNPLIKIEQAMSDAIAHSLDTYRDMRDSARETMFHLLYGGLQGFLPAPANEQRDSGAVPHPASQRGAVLEDSPEVRRILDGIAQGGFAEAVIRMMVMLADARGTVRRSRLQRSDRLLHEDPAFAALSEEDIKRIIFEQTLIVEFQHDAALATLASLLPNLVEAERAVSAVESVAGPVEEMEERTIAILARMREVLGLRPGQHTTPSEAA